MRGYEWVRYIVLILWATVVWMNSFDFCRRTSGASRISDRYLSIRCAHVLTIERWLAVR